ncbi:MAG: TonB-dependent receptor [Balneolaceae bacterium]
METGLHKYPILLLLAGLLSIVLTAGEILAQTTVQGIITDRPSGQPLEGANVTLRELSLDHFRGMATDQNGFYQVTNLEPGEYAFRVSFIGYNTFEDTLTLSSEEVRTVSIELEPDEEQLDEVIVAPSGGAARVQAGRQRVTSADIRRVPTPGGGGDLASYLQALPGVVAAGDRGGQLFIRGGTPTGNMVLMDGTMIFQPFHILGFFSVFPSDLVNDADVYAGGFAPRYSGRISSVIDVKMRDGDRYEPGGSVTVSPFLGEVTFETPIARGESAIIAAVRRSLIEETSPWFLPSEQPLRFESQYLKLSHYGENDTRCSAMTMRTYDRGQLDFERGEVFKWNNFVLGGRCVILPPGSDLLFDMNAGLSHVSNAVGQSQDPDRFSKVTRFNLDVNLTRYIGPTRFNYGMFVRMQTLNFDMSEQFQIPREGRTHMFSGGGNIEAIIPLGDPVTIYPGTVLTLYRQNFPPTLEPRFRMSWEPPGLEDAELNLAFGRYTQTLVGLNDTRDASSVFTAWMPPPLDESPIQSLHALAGWQQSLGGGFHISLEGYHKWISDQPVAVWNTLAQFTTDLALADGRIYGSDFRLEYNRLPVYGFIGYGFSWIEYEAAQDHFNIWFGEPVQKYHPSHDRRHQLNGLLSVELGKYTVGLRWQLGTGLPFTQPIGFDEVHYFDEQLPNVRQSFGTPRVILDKPFQGRTPTYHRLDLSLERSILFPSYQLNLEVGAINTYDHTNFFYYDVFTHRRIDQIPFAPYISLQLETR